MWRFIRDFMIYGFASVIGKVAAIFLMPIYTNILTKEEYGMMALITSCSGVIGLVSNLNIHSGIARDYYEEGINRRALVSTGLFSILTISALVMIIMIVTKQFWMKNVLNISENYTLPFVVMLLSVPMDSLQLYFAILTRYKKKPVTYSIGMIISLILTIGISIYGVVILRSGIVSIFLGHLAGLFFLTLFFASVNRKLIAFTFAYSYLKRALLFSLPTLPAILAGWVDNSLGQVLIGKFCSMEELGVYSIAISLTSVFVLISTAFQNVWFPFLYENYHIPEFQEQIKKIFTAVSFALFIISSALSLFSNEIILLLSNSSYTDAGRYITVLVVPMCFYLMFPFASAGVTISRDTKFIGISYVIGGCINLSLLISFIKFIGVIAVPLCLATSRIITYYILYITSEKRLKYNLPNYLLVLLAMSMIGLYYINILHLSIIYRAIVFVLSCYFFLLFIDKNTKRDMTVIISGLIKKVANKNN